MVLHRRVTLQNRSFVSSFIFLSLRSSKHQVWVLVLRPEMVMEEKNTRQTVVGIKKKLLS